MALVTAGAIWRMLALMRRLSDTRDEIARVNLQAERSATAASVEAASLQQALESARERLQEAFNDFSEREKDLRAQLATAQNDLSLSRQEATRLATSLSHIEQERQEREKMMESQFRNLANDILRQNSADFKEQNEQRLQEILSPLKENIDDFRKTVSETYSNEARERFSLNERIRDLVELNNTISREARDLTRALRGNNKVQGDWGEMVLETILERSGLQEGEEYFLQHTHDEQGNTLRGDDGRQLRPDVVVRYPDGRCVVIDSKVSLTAFVEYVNAEDEKTKNDAASRHLRSVRNHIDELAHKNYQQYVGKSQLDFVMMFIPNEPAYIAAMRLDSNLWQEAYDRHVLIVSPTHLVSGLKLIEQLWSRDKVTKNTIKIAEDAGKMYDKFADFTRDMERVSKALSAATKAHSDAVKKLSGGTGNLVKRAEDLRALGIKANKQLAASMLSNDDDEPLSISESVSQE